jgi:hypothetical protein
VVDREEFLAIGRALLHGLMPAEKGIRLLGLTLSNLNDPGGDAPAQQPRQLPLIA